MDRETRARRFKLGGPNFAQDVIDGEAIIVNLEKGIYYSLDQAGALIWQSLSKGESDQEVLAELLGSYRGQVSEIECGLQDLVSELEREGILVADGDGPHQSPAAILRGAEGKPAFAKPNLQKYNDMEAILVLDPIHEVDMTGWPYAKPGA